MKYLILRKGSYVGNSLVWWRPNSCGYTTNIDEAGRYDYEEAKNIMKGDDIAFEEQSVLKYATRHIDSSALNRDLEVLIK